MTINALLYLIGCVFPPVWALACGMDIMIISFMAYETIVMGEIGGFMKTEVYNISKEFRFLYNVILDYDGLIARAVLYKDQYFDWETYRWEYTP